MIKVLYTDDEPALLEIGKLFLERSGELQVETAISAKDAIRMLKDHAFDVIVSDYQMPGMDGIELLKNLRGKYGALPFILFTGRGREEVVIDAINNGADFYLQKGGEPKAQFAELEHKIRQSVQRHRTEQRIVHFNRLYVVLSKVNTTIVRAKTRDELFADICRITVEEGKFTMAWIGLLDTSKRTIVPVAHFGFEDGYLQSVQIDDNPFEQGPSGRAVRECTHVIYNNISCEPRMELWYADTGKRGYRSTGAFPLYIDNIRVGVLQLYSVEENFFSEGEIRLLDEVASDISFALERMKAEESRVQTEASLQESEERYRNIVEDQTEFICRFLPDGTHIFVNDAYCRYFGVAREDILGHRFRPVLYADDREALVSFFTTLTPEKPVGTIDHRIIMPDGTIRWQRWSDRAIFDDKGTVVEYQSVGRDITEYKEVEERLQTTVMEYQNLLENMTDVYYRSDSEGRLILASQSWARLLGYPYLSECIGRNIARTFYANPDDRSLFLEEVYQNGYVNDYEITLIKKDGSPVTVATSSYLYFDDAGHVLGVEGTFRDITERKRITEDLKVTEGRLTDIINFLPDATFAIDRKGIVIAWNHAIEEMTGLPAKDIIGKGNYEYALPFYGVRCPILIDLIETDVAELEKNIIPSEGLAIS